MSKIFKSFFSLIFGTWGICPSPSSISKLCKYLYLWRVGVTKHERGGETWFNTYFSTIIIRRVSQETHGPWIGTWLQLFGSTGYDTFFPPFTTVGCLWYTLPRQNTLWICSPPSPTFHFLPLYYRKDSCKKHHWHPSNCTHIWLMMAGHCWKKKWKKIPMGITRD